MEGQSYGIFVFRSIPPSKHYHLAIENCESRFYFTEKLLDCFLTDTIPIYWGCQNIGEYFDLRGIRQARTADELIAACNAASDADYAASRDAIAENHRRANAYLDLGARLGSLIGSRMEATARGGRA